MHKSATKCNKTIGKWCKNKHGASKIIDTFETYHSFCSFIRLLVVSYSHFLFLFCIVDALKAANARIAAPEAELNASREAWDIATAMKVAAEKSAKSAEKKVKKAKKSSCRC
jgi:hypothetical protein